ncbi:MAG: hypothetical protein IKK47_01720 [Ruminococcus sp.]|nr:hypothetical protein [Ruminococcus sp.]
MKEKNYDDIISLPHYVSQKRPKMPMHDRAAQFSPFAALTGYEEAVAETARLTDFRLIPDEEHSVELDRTIRLILDNIGSSPEITVFYFVPDSRKKGGKYEEYTGSLRTFSDYDRTFIFEDGKKIAINDIYNIRFAEK